jgi:hypothetical protein
MPFPSVPWSSLVLVAGLSLPAPCLPSHPGQIKWKPLFDYTNLPPTNEEFWGPLGRAQVPMEGAIELAKETEKGTVRVLKAELRPGPEGAAWQLDVFVGDPPESPKRVSLSVSSSERKVLRRLELRAIPEDERALWASLSATQVQAEDGIEVAKKTAIGSKPQPMVLDPRARTLRFSSSGSSAVWDLEMMGFDRKEHLRRHNIAVDTQSPRFLYMVLLDRFVGTPLRRGVPTELENGMVVYDFREGEGEELTPDSKVKVNYWLMLLDNTKIRDTWKAKLPETFVVSQAPLKGMSAGLVGMKLGGKRKLCIPYPLAFGEAGNEIAPPKAMVVCDISIEEILSE